jgi:DNA polymerase III psi subunit
VSKDGCFIDVDASIASIASISLQLSKNQVKEIASHRVVQLDHYEHLACRLGSSMRFALNRNMVSQQPSVQDARALSSGSLTDKQS